MADEIGNDQEIAGEAHLLDHPDLIIQSLPVNGLVRLGVFSARPPHDLLKSLARVVLEELVGGLLAVGVEAREMIGLEIELQPAAPCDLHRMRERLRGVLEIGRHFGCRLEIQLVGAELEPLRIVDGLAGLNAQQHVVGADVFAREIVAVVAGHQWNRQSPAHVDQRRIDPFLLVDAVVLNFEKEPVLAEHLQVIPRGLVGLLQPALHDPARYFAVQAGRHPDQTAGAILQELPVDPRPVVKALQLSRRGQPTQIAIAFLIFRQQDDVAELAVVGRVSVEPAARGKIHLAADDRLDAGLARLFVKLDGPEQGAVIGGRHGRHAVGGGSFDQIVDADRPVQQAVLGVDVQMNEVGHRCPMKQTGCRRLNSDECECP